MRQIRELTGQKFGLLTALEYERKNGVTKWLCECACGKKTKVRLTNLTSGAQISCGCKKIDNNKARTLNLAGKVFGKLTAVRIDEERTSSDASGKIIWECCCDCGEKVSIQANNLRSGASTTCGGRVHRIVPSFDKERLFRKVFWRYRDHAIEKGVSFELSIGDFADLCLSPCHYCGEEYSSHLINGRGKRNGIDCKNPKIGYVQANVVPCCWRCNRMKNVMNYEEFIERVGRIYSRMK